MTGARDVSQAAERALEASVETQRQIKVGRLREKKLLRKRRGQWLRAVFEPGSAVTRERIAKACRVSIQSVDTELAAARSEAADG